MYISISQALNFWDNLVRAYYVSDETEVYIYTMMPSSPLFNTIPESPLLDSDVLNALNAIRDLCTRFQDTYNCKILICGLSDFSHLEDKVAELRWRLVIQIVKPNTPE